MYITKYSIFCFQFGVLVEDYEKGVSLKLFVIAYQYHSPLGIV